MLFLQKRVKLFTLVILFVAAFFVVLLRMFVFKSELFFDARIRVDNSVGTFTLEIATF